MKIHSACQPAVQVAPTPRPQRRGLTITEFFVVIAIIVIVIALLLPAVRNGRGPHERTQCRNNLKQIGLALYNYADVQGAFPPAYTVDENGKPLHSWRTLILPYFDQSVVADISGQAFYEKIDLTKPWDHPDNAEVFSTLVPVYCCPSSPLDTQNTTYLAVMSPEGFFRTTEPRALADVTDGTNQTVMVVEASPEHAVPWMAPRDISAAKVLSMTEETQFHHAGGFFAMYVDGSVNWLAADTPPAERHRLFTIAAGDNPETTAEE